MPFDTRLLTGLNVLASVVETGSFVRAGEAMGLTQSAVSRSIQRLEERLAFRLLERTSKAVRLTDEGRRFWQEARPLLDRLEEVTEDAVSSTGTVRGCLRVNVEPAFCRLVLAAKLGGFLNRHPELRVELFVRDALGDLVADGFDVAVRFGGAPGAGLSGRCLSQVRIVTCASPAYLKRCGHPRTPADLVKEGHECLLFRNPASGVPYPWEFHRRKKRLRVPVAGRLVVNDAPAYLEACLAGVGIAQLLHLGIEPLLATGKLIDLFADYPDERFPLWAYYPARQVVPAKLRAWLDFLGNAGEVA